MILRSLDWESKGLQKTSWIIIKYMITDNAGIFIKKTFLFTWKVFFAIKLLIAMN